MFKKIIIYLRKIFGLPTRTIKFDYSSFENVRKAFKEAGYDYEPPTLPKQDKLK